MRQGIMKQAARLAALLLLFTPCLSPPSAEAGKGRVDDNELELTVYFSLPNGYDEATWRDVFERTSRKLYDATEGGLKLGRVYFTRSPSLRARADVVVFAGQNRAETLRIAIGQVGPDTFIKLYADTHGRAARRDVDSSVGIVHELGHYLFGLDEEYEGCEVSRRGMDCRADSLSTPYYCSSQSPRTAVSTDPNCDPLTDPCCSRSACLMDAGTSLNPTRSEFCMTGGPAAFRHTALHTRQNLTNNMRSCWDTILASRFAQEIAGTGRALQAPSVTSGPTCQPLATVPAADVRILPEQDAVLIVVDRTVEAAAPGPNNAPSRLAWQQRAAIQALAHMRADTLAAVMLYPPAAASTGGTIRAATPGVFLPATDENRLLLEQVIATAHLQPYGHEDAATALAAAVNFMARCPDESVSGKSILFTTNGVVPPGLPRPFAAAEGLLAQNPRIAVHAVGVGAAPALGDLATLATSTGGTYEGLDAYEDMQAALPRAYAASRGENLLASVAGAAPVGDTVRREVVVDALTRDALFVFTSPAQNLVCPRIVAPNGAVFNPECGAAVPAISDATAVLGGVQVVEFDGRPDLKIFRVRSPRAGTWAFETETASNAPFTMQVYANAPALALSVEVDNAGGIQFPEPIRIHASPYADGPVGGVDVRATITHPDGYESVLVLFDDGLPEHADARAYDGIYSAMFNAYRPNQNGVYDILVRAKNTAGYRLLGTEAETLASSPTPVPSFELTRRVTAIVQGIGGAITPATVSLGRGGVAPVTSPIPQAQLATSPVFGFSLQSSGEELDFRSVRLTSFGPAPETAIERVNLYLDADRDGVIDNPMLPLAVGAFDADDGSVLLGDTRMLVQLPAGVPNEFLVTFSPPPPAGAGAPPPPSVPPTKPFPHLPVLLALLLALLAGFALRTVGQRARGPLRGALATGASVVLLLGLLGAVGCGGGHHDGPPNPPVIDFAGDYQIGLAPANVDVRGATTRVPLVPSGVDVVTIARVQ